MACRCGTRRTQPGPTTSGAGRGALGAFEIEGVDLASYLVRELRAMAAIAHQLGLAGEVLKQIISPFLHNVRSFNLTPRQLEIVTLIKEGKTTKEIAELLYASKDAIDMQRFLIRKKLGLNKDKTNLRSLLLSL